MKAFLVICSSLLGIATAGRYEHPYPQVYAPQVVPAYYPPVNYAPSPVAASAPAPAIPYNRDVSAYDYSKYPASSYNRDATGYDYSAPSPAYSSYAPAPAAQPAYYSPSASSIPSSSPYQNHNYAPAAAPAPVASPAPVARPYSEFIAAAPPPNAVEAFIFTPAQVVGYAPGPPVGASTAYGKRD